MASPGQAVLDEACLREASAKPGRPGGLEIDRSIGVVGVASAGQGGGWPSGAIFIASSQWKEVWHRLNAKGGAASLLSRQ